MRDLTRAEWYKHHREKRIERKQIISLSVSTFGEMFKEYFNCILSEADQAKVDLIDRYWDKVSYRLKREYREIKERGKENAKATFTELVQGDYVLRNIPKDDIWTGSVLINPYTYKK